MYIIGQGWRRNLAKLLATGQLTSYGSGTGVDDGGLKKGIVKRYTILTTGQYSGTTNIALNGKTDAHSNNCVYDQNTGLMWSRYASATVGPNSNGTLPWTTNGSGEGIFPYCAAANAASLAGHTDWRINNIFEIASIVDEEAPNGYPDPVAWPTLSGTVWTSTTTTSNVAAALNSYMPEGAFYGVAKTQSYPVLLVRG